MFPVKLSLEQEFAIARFGEDIKTLSRSECQAFLVDLYCQIIIKETLYKNMLLSLSGFSTK
jgi:hypothetical protein